MKISVNIARVLVGLLFIFSGLVKANDPLGLSYKMHDFFEIWGMTKFNSWTLLMSVLMNAFEIIAGFALLFGWRIRLFTWLLLLLIIFFTFLTGYTVITGKPHNCGCFGDCLPITALTSFLKDLVLLALIVFLFIKKDLIKPLFREKISTISMFGITALAFGMQWYVLTYLPFVDCLPFKKGNNISEKRQMPANAIPDKVIITYNYLKDAEVFVFPADSVPADVKTRGLVFAKKDSVEVDSVNYRQVVIYTKKGTGTNVNVVAPDFPADFTTTNHKYILIDKKEDRIEGKNNKIPISGFDLFGVTNVDSTDIILSQPYAVFILCEDFSVPVSKWQGKFDKLYPELKAKNIPAYLITGRPEQAATEISKTSFSDIQVLRCDTKAIQTAARTNPCFFLIKQGTVIDKQSFRRLGSIRSAVKKLP